MESIVEEMNIFAKDILSKIAKYYSEELGNNNIQYLYFLLQQETIVKSSSIINRETDMILPKLSKTHNVYLDNDKLVIDEKVGLEQLKSDMIHTLFHLVIHPNEEIDRDPKKQEFFEFLTEGLVEKYANDFSLKNNIERNLNRRYAANIKFVEGMMEAIPDEMSKDKIVFQYQYPYILELCQIATSNQNNYGINYYNRYDKHYLRQKDYLNIANLITETYPDQSNITETVRVVLERYQEIGTKEYAKKNLLEMFSISYCNNPYALENIKTTINQMFEGTYAGFNESKGNSLVLAKAGYFEGALIVGLSLLLGIVLSFFLLQ